MDILDRPSVFEGRELPAVVKDVHRLSLEMAAFEEARDAARPGDLGRRFSHRRDRPDRAAHEDLRLVQVGRDEVGFSSKDVQIAWPSFLFEKDGARARSENRVDDPGDVRVPGQDPGDGGQVPGRADHADLDPGDDGRFRQPSELTRDGPRREWKNAVDPFRILGGDGREHAEAPIAEALEDPDVEKDARPCRGVVAGDRDEILRHFPLLPHRGDAILP
jgi:hypothetical protein